MRMRAVILAAVALGGTGVGLAALNLRADATNTGFGAEAARRFDDFPLYAPGERFRGLALTSIDRRAGADEEALAPAGTDYVSFKYGACTPNDVTGCPAPLEVQIWPACARNPSLYSLTPDPDGPAGPGRAVPYPREPVRLRGVPGAFFDAGRRLELYTGDVTVVLWGRGREQLLDAARALRGVTSQLAAEEPLPPPVPGAREGSLNCP